MTDRAVPPQVVMRSCTPPPTPPEPGPGLFWGAVDEVWRWLTTDAVADARAAVAHARTPSGEQTAADPHSGTNTKGRTK